MPYLGGTIPFRVRFRVQAGDLVREANCGIHVRQVISGSIGVDEVHLEYARQPFNKVLSISPDGGLAHAGEVRASFRFVQRADFCTRQHGSARNQLSRFSALFTFSVAA